MFKIKILRYLLSFLFTSIIFIPANFVNADTWDGIILLVNENTTYGGGNGTEQSPYLISSAEHLALLSSNVNTSKGKCFLLTQDIDLGINNKRTPIGTNISNPFMGVFDGNNKKINNLSIENLTDYQGLFGYVNTNGKVKNLGIVDSSVSGDDCVGGIVGNNQGIVQNCYYTGNVNGTSKVGGIVGRNELSGIVENCYFNGEVKGPSNSCGGIVGENSTTVNNCYFISEPNINNDVEVCGRGEYNTSSSKTCEQFYSGEVAKLLQNNDNDTAWGQDLSNQSNFPVLTDDISLRVCEMTISDNLIYKNVGSLVSVTAEQRPGFKFIGWYNGNTLINLNISFELIAADINLYAKYALFGDIDEDSDIDVLDMILLKNIIINISPKKPQADFNNDGAVDIIDLLLIKSDAL